MTDLVTRSSSASLWDRRFFAMAKGIASWSKDEDRKVGAIIVHNKHILSMGYNGFSRRLVDKFETVDVKRMKTVHAEANALLRLDRKYLELPLDFYVYGGFPCAQCAALMLQTNVQTVIAPQIESSKSSWAESMEIACQMFVSAGVKIIHYN